MRLFQLCILALLLMASTTANLGQKSRKIDYFVNKAGLHKEKFDLKHAENGQLHITEVDDYRDIWTLVRQLITKKSMKFWQYLYNYNWREGKLQKPRKSEEFPCVINGTRSPEPPNSVNAVRPGDIDIIAAVGDSMTSGNAAISKTPLGTYVEYRGLTFSGGGMADWRSFLTLPNILKVFNPNLYGYATANSLTIDRQSHLNVAEPMLLSRDLVYQVQVLIQRMKMDPRIDMQNHWKLLTIFVGLNDFCTDMCHNDNMWDFLRRHEEDLKKAFTVLRENVPRLIVNLLSPPNVADLMTQIRGLPLLCKMSYSFSCSCLSGKKYSPGYLQAASEFIRRWQAIDEHVANLPEFQMQDFAVLYQPFMVNVTMPTKTNGDVDLRYFGGDCFHFSQLGHASMANALWNNMLQARDQKQTKLEAPFEKFECPSDERPFIAV